MNFVKISKTKEKIEETAPHTAMKFCMELEEIKSKQKATMYLFMRLND